MGAGSGKNKRINTSNNKQIGALDKTSLKKLWSQISTITIDDFLTQRMKDIPNTSSAKYYLGKTKLNYSVEDAEYILNEIFKDYINFLEKQLTKKQKLNDANKELFNQDYKIINITNNKDKSSPWSAKTVTYEIHANDEKITGIKFFGGPSTTKLRSGIINNSFLNSRTNSSYTSKYSVNDLFRELTTHMILNIESSVYNY